MHGDLLEQNGGLEIVAQQLSRRMKRPVLTTICMDSDALFLTLHRGVESKAVHAGEWEEPSAEPTPEFWRDCVQDMSAFTAALHGDYVFAEEALEPLSACFGFSPQQICFPEE